jgi:hypothetical protein
MKKSNRQTSVRRHVPAQTLTAMKQMELYCLLHPGSPAAVRRPRLFSRSRVWIALLGPSVEAGIFGIGANAEAALRAFDVQYLDGLRPPAEARKHRRIRAPRRDPKVFGATASSGL